MTSCSVNLAPGAVRHPAELSSSGPAACPPLLERTIRIADHGAPGGWRYAQIFTPAGVAHPERLPVLYFLHGYPGGGDNIGGGPTASAFRARMCAGAAPFILVAPDGNSAGHEDTEFADAADGRFDVESFITGPLIRSVEGKHRRPARLRAIAGFSMGGFGAADLALRHPRLYGQFVSIAGYFTIDDPSGAFGRAPGPATTADRRAHEPLLLAVAARGKRVLLVGSTRDGEKLDAGQDARFAPLLREHGATVVSLTLDGPHTYGLVVAAVPEVVRFLEVGWGQ